MLEAIQAVLMIFALILIGVVLTRKGWFDERVEQLFSRLVVNIALPGMIIHNLLSSYTRQSLMEGLPGIAALFISQPLSIAAAYGVAYLFRIPAQRRGVFVVMFSFSNSIFIGVPVTMALFGQTAMPFALMFYIVNTLLFWTAGVYGIARDGSEKAPFFSTATLKRLLSAPLITFVLAMALIFIGIKPPSIVMNTAQYLGNLVTPLSLFFTGINLARMGLRGLKPDASLLLVGLGRFVVAPALVILTFFVMESMGVRFGGTLLTADGLVSDTLMRDVFFIQAAMPVMAQTGILAGVYGADSEYATLGLAVTTLASLLVMPLFRVLITLV